MNPTGQNPAVPPDPPPIPTSKITANKDLEDLNLNSALKQKTPQGNPDENQYKELINLALNNPDFLQALQSALVKVNNTAEDAKKRKGDDQFKVSTNYDRPVKNYNKGNASNKIDNHDPNPKPNSTQKNIDSDEPATEDHINQNLNQQILISNAMNNATGGQRSKPSGPSKPTFAAAVQSRLTSSSAGKTHVDIKHGTHLGKPAVYFSAEDYFGSLAQDCKWTIVGKFIKGKPTMEELRKLFIGQFQLLGTVKIAFYDYRCVYMDFTNEVDFKHIYFKPFIDIGPYTMKVMKWTPDFKPEQETSTVPIWILIHKLPWHLFRWDILSKLVQSIGIAVAPDQATFSKSRGNVAKIKVEIDLLRPKQEEIWLGYKRPDGSEDGEWLKIEYEDAPSYCAYCRLQGHTEMECRTKINRENEKRLREEQMKNIKTTTPQSQETEDGFQEVSRKKGKQNRKNVGVVISEPNAHDQKKKTLPLVEGKGKNATNETTNNVVIGEQQQRTEKGETSRLQEEKQDQNEGEKILDEETHISGNKHKTQKDDSSKKNEHKSNKNDNKKVNWEDQTNTRQKNTTEIKKPQKHPVDQMQASSTTDQILSKQKKTSVLPEIKPKNQITRHNQQNPHPNQTTTKSTDKSKIIRKAHDNKKITTKAIDTHEHQSSEEEEETEEDTETENEKIRESSDDSYESVEDNDDASTSDEEVENQFHTFSTIQQEPEVAKAFEDLSGKMNLSPRGSQNTRGGNFNRGGRGGRIRKPVKKHRTKAQLPINFDD
uniref:LINE-type retrotransposon LIb DNA, complete sequence, Insertion at the S11 site n=1 Tax=Solanum tuberosum TaxID=4113 RepID=M1DQL1_SOLTU